MRFRWILFALLVCVLTYWQGRAIAQDAETTLTAEVLAKTLYAVTPSEVQYCEDIINARNAGILPNKILFAAYKYAMKKEKDRRMVYFEIVIADLCKKQGIVLSLSSNASTRASGKSGTPFTSGTGSSPLSFFKPSFSLPKPKFNLF